MRSNRYYAISSQRKYRQKIAVVCRYRQGNLFLDSSITFTVCSIIPFDSLSPAIVSIWLSLRIVSAVIFTPVLEGMFIKDTRQFCRAGDCFEVLIQTFLRWVYCNKGTTRRQPSTPIFFGFLIQFYCFGGIIASSARNDSRGISDLRFDLGKKLEFFHRGIA